MMTDPIADLLARIRNASMARHELTRVPANKLKKNIALCRMNVRYAEPGSSFCSTHFVATATRSAESAPLPPPQWSTAGSM